MEIPACWSTTPVLVRLAASCLVGPASLHATRAATGTTVVGSDAKLTERVFKVNLACHFILIKEFLPAMLRAKKGHIVTIASMASFAATPGLVDYSCTKIGALYLHEGEA